MSYPLYRRGTFAVIDGVSYPVSYANGDNYVRFADGDENRPTPYPRDSPVPVDLCERVFSVQVYASYRGHSVLVDGVDELGGARVMDAEWDGEWATINGFVQENRYEYYKHIDLRDLRDYYEKQSDLLFTRWRAAHFARPIDGHPFRGGWANGESAVVGGRPRSGILEIEDGRVTEVTTRAEYRGFPCEIAGISPDGSVGLYYVGVDQERAEADGFRPRDGRPAKTVHVYDLARYHEHHLDLQFERWRQSREFSTER
ncbi:hypothetical protein FNH05_27175 [Amycolatopsis rhizosphaerae]|uniref:Uncharacterized protein n=1 Tax=Amycolatopsis rhizosphaerae TaxID=2053003 RepID=A0A558BA28_9PSEU|nr:hypothetical protein [Amycolatopsis rhizosphaerae]TVT33363.1 hypothetical protein FNH05_27175 [Amycolatopsis rhizosphaerae]